MRLTILHVPDCPNVATLQDRVKQASDGDAVEFTLRVVDNEELAAELGMAGSPTLLVDGVDPFAEPGRSVGVSCRLYRDETGHLSGAPSLAQLRRVLDPYALRHATLAPAAHETPSDGAECCAPANAMPPSSGGLEDWRARTAPRDPVAWAVHHAILRAFTNTGRPPVRTDLDQIAKAHGTTTEKTLADLHSADVIRLDAAGQITVAYPFSGVPTRHQVQLATGVRAWAMCAVYALGMPAMLDTDAVISSSDPGTDQPVTVSAHAGRYVWDPPTAVVFLSASAGEGPSADSCCHDLNFFATPASAQAWITAHPQLHGEILDPDSAERLGRQIFGTLLETDHPHDQVAAP